MRWRSRGPVRAWLVVGSALGALAMGLSPVTAAPAQAAPAGAFAVPSPGIEWFKGVACMAVECVGIGADDSGPLNGDPRSLVPINPQAGPGAPVTVTGLSEIDGVACEPSSAPQPSCLLVGASGALGGSFRAKFAWVGPHPGQGASPATAVAGMSDLSTAACTPSGICVAAGPGGVVVLPGGGSADVVSRPGLAPSAVACASDSVCLITEAKSLLSFDPQTKAFGPARPWPFSNGGALACPSPATCEAVSSPYNQGEQPSALFVRVDPATGVAGVVRTVPGTYAGSIACPTPTACVAVGSASTGSYPKVHQTPVIVPVRSGVPQAAIKLTGTIGSVGLDAVACADSAPALGPRDLTPAPCVAVGSAAAYSGPGVPTAGSVLALSAFGPPRHFVAAPPPTAFQRDAIGEMVATDNSSGQFYPCTATVVASAQQDLVIAAAHCVESLADNHKYVDIYFAPGHSGPTCAKLGCGVNPEGVWTAQPSDVTVYPDAAHHQRFDWAFVHVHPSVYELPIEEVTGALELSTDPTRQQAWTVYGYPDGPQVSPGVYQLSFKQCQGTSTAADGSIVGGPGPLGLFIGPPNCDKETAGASGGPWVDSQGQVGAVNKVQNAGMGIVGTYLGDEADKAYAAATA